MHISRFCTLTQNVQPTTRLTITYSLKLTLTLAHSAHIWLAHIHDKFVIHLLECILYVRIVLESCKLHLNCKRFIDVLGLVCVCVCANGILTLVLFQLWFLFFSLFVKYDYPSIFSRWNIYGSKFKPNKVICLHHVNMEWVMAFTGNTTFYIISFVRSFVRQF